MKFLHEVRLFLFCMQLSYIKVVVCIKVEYALVDGIL